MQTSLYSRSSSFTLQADYKSMVSALSLLVSILSLGAAVAQCGTGSAQLSIDVMYDGSAFQTTFELDGVPLPVSQSNSNLIRHSPCVTTNALHKIAIKDVNGLSGNAYASISINGKLIATIRDFTGKVVYYFFAGPQDCGLGSRFALNLKYDHSPAETAWSLRKQTGNQVVLSEASLGGDYDLANQFLYLDQCVDSTTYTFSITDQNGIDSPGFFRIFNEMTLLDVGGGNQGFTGTVSKTFTVADVNQPTPAPTIDICDDDQFATFPDTNNIEEGGMPRQEPCIWLLDRPQLIDAYCAATHPSGARNVCEETCGVCTDNCVDNEKARFSLGAFGDGKSCEWVRVRVQANDATNRPLFCNEDTQAWTACPETCENCPTVLSQTLAPTPDPIISDPCDDSITTTIFIDSIIGSVPCRWLATRPSQQPRFCAPADVSNAFNVCAETCGKCTDNCEDATEGTFTDKRGIERPCSWLADDSNNRRPFYCFPDDEAYTLCKETCGNCASE